MSGLRQFFSGFSKGFSNFGHTISAIINSVLLLIVYVLGVGLTWLVAKIVRKQFLQTKVSHKQATYWSELGLKKQSTEKYYRQF
jgi:hypothetical protein